MKKIKVTKEYIFVNFVFITLIASAVFTIVRMSYAPTIAPPNIPGIRVKGYYVLMLLQCILGVVAMLVPTFISRRAHIKIPKDMFIVYAAFLYCAIYLGEVRSFYYIFPYWDSILHAFSGVALGALGFSTISLFNRRDTFPVNLSPFFVAMFAFCFAVMLGAIWEIYEFSIDAIFNTNMQKYALESGQQLVGRLALVDTMEDIITDVLGALTMAIVGYISIKYKKGWIEKIQLNFSSKN